MKKTLVNGRWLFMAILFLLLIVLGVIGWDPSEWWYAAIVIGIGGVAFVAHFLLVPYAYRFDERGLTLYYGFGLRARAEWGEIRSVSVWHDRVFPWLGEYRIGYFRTKLTLHGEGIVPKTKKTAKLLQTYWNGKID